MTALRLPISLKIFSITLALLVLMLIVTALSAMNFRQLNNQVRALADYYLPLQQQVASVEILIRQQMVHMERVLGVLAQPGAALEAIEVDSNRFDMRGINADQIIDSSIRMLTEAEADESLALDRVTLAALARQLPAIQTARQDFHRTFRLYLIEFEEGTPRSQRLVREALLANKDAVDAEIGEALDVLNRLTRETAERAREEEARATVLNWIITAIAGLLGLIFAGFVTRSLVDPVKRLLGGTRAVEAGDLGVAIEVKSRDELAVLADSFNHMVDGLREKERIRETFGQYVDPRIVQRVLEKRLATEGGERQPMTVFFSDLEGFTRLCENLTPDMAVRYLNRYFAHMAAAVRAREGIIDKYIGDAVMAFWGPPFVDAAEHARLACLAALDQMARLDAFRAELPTLFGVTEGLPVVNVRMGLASGEVTVGNIGSDTSRGYTVIGDTVNLASRLEQANRFYGTRILLAESTWQLAGAAFLTREIDSLRVAGKRAPVRVFELVGEAEPGAMPPAWVEAYAAGLAAYRAQDWEAADSAFAACLAARPGDRPAQVMRERIAVFRTEPPAPDWQGVWVARGK